MEVALRINAQIGKYTPNVQLLEMQSLIAIEKMCEQYIEKYLEHVDYDIVMQLLIFRDEVSDRLRRLKRLEKLKNYYKIYK